MERPFHELTTEEAKKIVNQIRFSSNSEEEIRRRLNKAGFNGTEALITTYPIGKFLQASIMVYGPKGELIC